MDTRSTHLMTEHGAAATEGESEAGWTGPRRTPIHTGQPIPWRIARYRLSTRVALRRHRRACPAGSRHERRRREADRDDRPTPRADAVTTTCRSAPRSDRPPSRAAPYAPQASCGADGTTLRCPQMPWLRERCRRSARGTLRRHRRVRPAGPRQERRRREADRDARPMPRADAVTTACRSAPRSDRPPSRAAPCGPAGVTWRARRSASRWWCPAPVDTSSRPAGDAGTSQGMGNRSCADKDTGR